MSNCLWPSTPGFPFTVSWSLLKLMSIESVVPSNRLILCHPLLLLPSIFPSIKVCPNESVLHIRWPKYWSFSFSISPSNECSGLISFRMDWLDLLAVQGTLNGFLQHHSSKASILWCWVFFMVQLSHPYMTIGKTVASTIQTFVGKVMSLLFNMLPRFVIAFLPRSKHLLISWMQSWSTAILEPKKIKSVTISMFSPSIFHKVMGSPLLNAVFHLLWSGASLVKGTQHPGSQSCRTRNVPGPRWHAGGQDLFQGDGCARQHFLCDCYWALFLSHFKTYEGLVKLTFILTWLLELLWIHIKYQFGFVRVSSSNNSIVKGLSLCTLSPMFYCFYWCS